MVEVLEVELLPTGDRYIELRSSAAMTHGAHLPRRRSNPLLLDWAPLSPLAFLVIAEALTRLIQNDPHIKGIEINGEHIKISQFADDTSLFSESYEEFLIALEWVEVYEKATGSKVNTHKYVGIQWGTHKGRPPPLAFRQFNWLQPGQHTKILGILFWSTGENDSFGRAST
eukprot:scaffold2725_cov119-Isochrysis_galbana.AAC.8